MIEYMHRSENSIADALYSFDLIAVGNEGLNKLAPGVLFFRCPVAKVDRFEIRNYLIAEQQSNITIAFVINLLKRKACLQLVDLENLLQLKL